MAESAGIHIDIFKPFPLILIHTPFGLKFFDALARTRVGKIYAKFNTYLMPIITVIAIILVVGSLVTILSNVSVREFARGIGPQGNLLIPGINPILPISYTLIALIISVFIHEAGHGVVARVYNLKVESTGIATVLGIPVGAFVNISQEELHKSTLKQRSAVLTAGVLNNMILSIVSLILLYALISNLSPIPNLPGPSYGLSVTAVGDDSLAKQIGISTGSTIQQIGEKKIHTSEELNTLLHSNIGGRVNIIWLDNNGNNRTRIVNIPSNVDPSKPILGVSISSLAADPGQALEIYKHQFVSGPIPMLPPPTMAQGITPFSDLMAPKYTSSIFGNSFPIIANMLYWLWFINFNLGIFNALPIGPLDGGQLYGSLIESRSWGRKTHLKNLSNLISIIMISVVVMSIAIPFLL